MVAESEGRHIFISYSHEDKAFTFRLAEDLKNAEHPVWLDKDIQIGSEWTDEVQAAIDDCYAFVVILSPDSVGSSWVRKESLYAIDEKSGPIYPIMYRKVKLPLWLRGVQHVDFQGDYNMAFARLLSGLPRQALPHLPEYLEPMLESANPTDRRMAVVDLKRIALGNHPDFARRARKRLELLAKYDLDERVRGTARDFFGDEES